MKTNDGGRREEQKRMNCRIVDGADQMAMEDIARLLKITYWADHRPAETIVKSVSN